MNQYIRLCKTLYDKGKLIRPDELYNYVDSETDYYTSIYYYNDEHLKRFQEKKTIKGIRDVVTNQLVLDFDAANPEDAKKDALQAIARFNKYGIDNKNIEVYFSGNKGFNLVISLNKYLTPEQCAGLVLYKFGKDLKTLDSSLYDPVQILRVPGTRHQKSGLYKIPLTFNQLNTMPISDIKQLATSLDNIRDEFKYETVSPNETFYKYDMPIEHKKSEYSLELNKKPAQWRACKWSLLQGNFKEGERHNALMTIAATARGLGYDRETTYYMCKSAVKKAAKNNVEEYSKDDLWTNIVESVFDDAWEGGQYTCTKPGWLQTYCQSLGDASCKHDVNYKLIEVNDIKKQFVDYAVNFEKNIIKTGVSEIDNNVMFLAATHNGILGQPGCHAKGTKILMFDGTLKNVEDVVVGDLLMGPDSTSREVLQLARGRDKMVRVIPNKGEPFVINQHHVLNLKPSIGTNNKAFECNLNIMFKDYIEKTTKVVKNRYKIHRVPIIFNNDNGYKPIPPYILGAWLGDGISSKPELVNTDQEVINEWKLFAEQRNLTCIQTDINYRLNRKTGKEENTFLNDLRNLNLLDNKHIPHNYLVASKKDRLELLAGLLDTDGHLDQHHKKHFDYISKLKHLSESVVYLCRSLGLSAYLNECQKSCQYKGETKIGTYYRVSISGDLDIIPCRIKRKQALKRLQCKDVLVTGFDYQLLDEDEYYGFTLDKDHLYLTSDFIVHHNSGKTSFAMEMLRYNSLNDIECLFLSLDMAAPIIYAKLVQKIKGCNFDDAISLYRENSKESKEISEQISEQYKNVNFNFKSGLTVPDIKDLLKQQEDERGKKVKLLVIDYLECLSVPSVSDATASMGFISNQLKDLANEEQVCSMLLLQTQKHNGTSDISDPILSMKQIKGSSQIEQSSSVVMSLWREGYNPRTISDDKYISFAVVKNRLGKLWQGDLGWDGQKGLFRSLTEEERFQLSDFRERKIEMRKQQEQEWE